MALEGLKIVAAQEMARIEKMAYADGASEQTFMENAGDAVAKRAEQFIHEHGLAKVVTLLVGKGNNGGDAFAAGVKLMEAGYQVVAIHIYSLDQCSPLCKKMHEKFRSRGGIVHQKCQFGSIHRGVQKLANGNVGASDLQQAQTLVLRTPAKERRIALLQEEQGLCKHKLDTASCKDEDADEVSGQLSNHDVYKGIILDGLVGTGFHGKADDVLALAIESANQSGLPILAIDIPSGVNGTTGEVESVAIDATETIFLGLPKSGFFLKNGWDHVGKLRYASFGLAEKYIAKAKAFACLLNEESMLLPPIKRTRHKYQAGYVIAIAGSPGMPGAALLASYAVLRAGAGIVRLFHPAGMEGELSGAPFEVIRQGWDEKNLSPIKEQAKKAKVMLIGPGIGRTAKAEKMFKAVLSTIKLPMVIDADALYFLSENPSWKLPPNSVLTPHHGEMDRLLSSFKKGKGKSDLEICQAYAEEKKTTIVLKGAPTLLFHPGTSPLVIDRGDPGMATAGSGDVLTGIIAAMIAQGLDVRQAAALGVYLHGLAGEYAASVLTSYGMTASDIIDFLPDVFSHLA